MTHPNRIDRLTTAFALLAILGAVALACSGSVSVRLEVCSTSDAGTTTATTAPQTTREPPPIDLR